MAKTKEEKAAMADILSNQTEQVEVKAEAPANGPSYDQLLAMVQQLAGEIATLKSGAPQQAEPTTNDKILELLSGRKSDREVSIVHNMELIGGLTTHIELTGVTVDFRSLGEERLLSWQQFEECVSKYRTFFEKGIISLKPEDDELAARYNLPRSKDKSSHVPTHEEMTKLGSYNRSQLEKYMDSLSESDREFVCSYWLGKCYERAEGFYDRYKVELLNSLSNKHIFDNILALMNGDFRNE